VLDAAFFHIFDASSALCNDTTALFIGILGISRSISTILGHYACSGDILCSCFCYVHVGLSLLRFIMHTTNRISRLCAQRDTSSTSSAPSSTLDLSASSAPLSNSATVSRRPSTLPEVSHHRLTDIGPHPAKTTRHVTPTNTSPDPPPLFSGHTPPFSGHPHPPPNKSSPAVSRHISPVAVVFAVLGGLLGLLVLFGIMRCLISYGRTPDHDRVAAFINRHRIQREMEELEEQQYHSFIRRSSLNGPPPPPYLPRPPSYHGHRDEVSAATPLNSSYNPRSDDSPPSTPPPIHRQAARSRASSPTEPPNR
jgi:hypothetical protein